MVIGVTGSILVFETQIEHMAYPHLWHSSTPLPNQHPVDFPAVIDTVMRAYPGYKITAAYVPDKVGDNFEVFVHRNEKFQYVFIDPNTGNIDGAIDPDTSWLVWIIGLHFRLLAGRTGEILNGIGAACLLLLCVTGAVVWWAGLRYWTRGVKVNFRKSWKRARCILATIGVLPYKFSGPCSDAFCRCYRLPESLCTGTALSARNGSL